MWSAMLSLYSRARVESAAGVVVRCVMEGGSRACGWPRIPERAVRGLCYWALSALCVYVWAVCVCCMCVLRVWAVCVSIESVCVRVYWVCVCVYWLCVCVCAWTLCVWALCVSVCADCCTSTSDAAVKMQLSACNALQAGESWPRPLTNLTARWWRTKVKVRVVCVRSGGARWRYHRHTVRLLGQRGWKDRTKTCGVWVFTLYW